MITPDEMTPAHPAFWDHFYESGEGSEGTYEWFMDYESYRDLVVTSLREVVDTDGVRDVPTQILHVGCGNSSFPMRLREEWRESPQGGVVTSIDICEGIVDEMRASIGKGRPLPAKPAGGGGGKRRKRHSRDTPSTAATTTTDSTAPLLSLDWKVMDCCKMTPSDASYHYVFDKGTIDALLSQCDRTTMAEGNANVFAYFREVYRVLKPGGAFLLVTINAPEIVLPYAMGADGEADFDWDVTTHTLHTKAGLHKGGTVRSHGGFNTAFLLVKPTAEEAEETQGGDDNAGA